MIHDKHPYFVLETKDLNYIFRVLPTGQLEHLYIGEKLIDQNYHALHTKITAGAGSQVVYEKDGHQSYLDLLPLEYSGIGKGDYRLTPLEIKMPDGSYVSDFTYKSHRIISGSLASQTLPTAYDDDLNTTTLIVTLDDEVAHLTLDLIYTVFYDANVFTRRAILTNHHASPIVIKKMMSMMIDLPAQEYDLLTFDGGWIKETHKHQRSITYGTYIIDSTTGASSNRHNPGIILAKKHTTEDMGWCLGINLVYSGNHYEAIHVSNHGMIRVMNGINPFCFEWKLEKNQSFETPESVISISHQGFNRLSAYMHHFVNHHIIPSSHKFKERPVVLNSWEAFYFDFNQRKLLKLAKQAKDLGVELFVLDDGWFGKRNDDTTSLGDYDVNHKKLPTGIVGLSKKLHNMGLKFGLWFEPEMISPKSNLYTKHPEYAINIPGRTPSLGRNQLVLDLCKDEVRAYIKQQLTSILDGTHIDYIKWDMNRHMSDMFSHALGDQGHFFHTYIIGLYDILGFINKRYPNMLIETCSSGGNRFDLGMLCYSAQIWASDNTDPIERLSIQQGLSYLYPQSAISCHVSLAPHAQTLRDTPLATRFNVASFGVLGYELNFDYVSPVEKKEIKHQISTYKHHRQLLQYGTFIRHEQTHDHRINWQITDGHTHILGSFQKTCEASPNFEYLEVKHIDSTMNYHIYNIKQKLPIKRFGHLIAHALPIKLNADGLIMRMIGRHKMLDNASIDEVASGQLLKRGLPLKQQFMGTYYNDQTRLIGDFGSMIYIINPIE